MKNNIESPDYHGAGNFSMLFSAAGDMQLGGYAIAPDTHDSGAKVENATGESGADVLLGNELDNVLTGNDGNDVIIGSDGEDDLSGGAGDDEMAGGKGDDEIDGGEGDDRALFSDVCSNYEIEKDGATGTIEIRHVSGTMIDGTDILTGVETAVFRDGTVDLTVDDPSCPPIDFVFLVDLSGSFSDDVPSFKDAAPAIFDLVRDTDPNAQFAVSSFIDLPVSPCGGPSDYVYRPDLAATDHLSAFVSAIDGLSTRSGADFPESQWAGLWGAANGVGLSLRENSRKIVLIATDAPAHSAADVGLDEGDVRASLDDNAIDTIGGTTADIIDPDDVGDTDPDYVGDGVEPLLSEALTGACGSVSTIVAAAGSRPFYEARFPDELAGSVVDLAGDGSNIADALAFALAEISGDVTGVGGNNTNDTLTGTPAPEGLFGRGGNDTILGLASDDTLVGGAGNDSIEGGDGGDLMRGGTGADALFGDDGDDRVDGEGLGEREIVERFFADDEVQALSGDLSDVGGFVQTACGNVLGREADDAGFQFWTEVVDSGAVPASQLVLELIAGAKAPASEADPEEFREQKEADAAYLADKKGLGICFGAIKGMSDVEDAAAVMAAYDGSDAGLQAAREIADSAYAQAAAGEEDLLVELVGVVEDPFAA